ncbi:MAG: TMEM175 family protein [Hyphomicrobiales bacterium]
MYPRVRLDALADAIFGVAMTLLVLDVRLPDDFHPQDAQELLRGLQGLTPKLLPYILSFLVLGLRWLSLAQIRIQAESVGRDYALWLLVYLLLITCVPLTTIVVGRFVDLAPSIWLYAGNTALIGIVSIGLLRHTPQLADDSQFRDRQVSLAVLIISSLLAVAWSFVDPRQALWAMALNVLPPLASRWWTGSKA